MFRTLIYPSSGACDCAVELPHRSFCSWVDVCWRFGAAGFNSTVTSSLWWVYQCLKHVEHIRSEIKYQVTSASACNTDTTPTQPHQISNTHRTKKKTTDVVIQHNSRKLLMMDILMSETCWVHKKWNKITSGIKLVFYSSRINLLCAMLCSSINGLSGTAVFFVFVS